jgi:hypothetical protein
VLTTFLALAVTLCLASSAKAAGEATIAGARRVWQPLVLDFTGPAASETDNSPNPFLDYRLGVTFTATDGTTYDVPGFFAGNGQGGTSGDIWRVRFAPDRPGAWTYRTSFRGGDAVAVNLDPAAGEAVAFDGASGTIAIDARDPEAAGFYRWGRLEYVGKHYLKFRDGPYWLRGGTDTPENLLGYAGFDDTPPSHQYEAHRQDWQEGDPDWGDGRGRAIIGAINYLAAEHVNSIYALTMNVGGDGKDVWPWSQGPQRKGSPENDNLHFDNSKLAQWNVVFTHAQAKGVFLHLVLDEGEEANKKELDAGELGTERKLYYRELIARFGHHPAVEWNLCEEYNLGFDLGPERVRAFADYIRAVDPYDHPITVHSAGDPTKKLAFTFGDERFSLTSIQLNQRRIDHVTEAIRRATAEAGRPLPVSLDEFTVDAGQGQSWMPVDDADKQRKEKIWPTYLSGGMIEFILEGLLDVESFKTDKKAALWRHLWHARRFMETELPFWEMAPHDELTRGAATMEVGIGKGKTSPLGAQVFCQKGAVYAVYLPVATSTGQVDLSATNAEFTLRWYDPRSGEFRGETKRLTGGDWVALGEPPGEPEEDWVALVKVADHTAPTSANTFPAASWEPIDPSEAGLDASRLDALAAMLGGRGAVIKNGRVVKSWGDQAQKSDWFSAAKPVLGTLLLFAIAEGKVDGVDAAVADFGWKLAEKDKKMTMRQLANMTSGYARPDPPGEAWAYNDFGVQLYQQTIFDRIFAGPPESIANDASRLGALGLEDGLSFAKTNRRLKASVRDFARIGWFWLNRGNWSGRQLIPGHLFDEVMRASVPSDLPHTVEAETNDYLGIGSFGGGSDHFTQYGAGTYGFNWWFNTTGRLHPDSKSWPDAADDLVVAIGFGGNCCALLPSQSAVLVAAEADWGKLQAGEGDTKMNQVLAAFATAVTTDAPREPTTHAGFEKVVLSRQYLCDGIDGGDINQDGNIDVVAGPYWYAGPSFEARHAFYPAVPLVPTKSPSNSMFSFVHDFNADGWPDVLTLGRVHLHPAYWYENPGAAGGEWRKHYAFERVQGESPQLVDLDGDGHPQIVCHWEGRWGWIEPDPSRPTQPWRFQPLSDPGEWKPFYHGTGVGDINGDGRSDLVINDGWFEQPTEARSVWTWHPLKFSRGRGGAQMFVYDVDNDGDADVISSLDAHGWGLAWFEQIDDAGTIAFRMHQFMGTGDEHDEYGVAFTQPHALDLADINGDGTKDLVVGKRMWAHGPQGDVEPGGAPVLYWFELVRENNTVRFVPHLVDDRSGVGVQITVADVNRDGKNDILTASKLGSFVFLNDRYTRVGSELNRIGQFAPSRRLGAVQF